MKQFLRKSPPCWRQLGCVASALAVINAPAFGADTGGDAVTAQDSGPFELKWGPFDFQPRASAGVKYDDNILFHAQNPESDEIWDLDPGIQAVAGDKLSLLAYRDEGVDPLQLSPDSLVVNTPDSWPGNLLILDDSPQLEWFTEHQQNNYIGNLGGFNALMPKTKFILGASFNYADQPITVVEAGQRTGEQDLLATISGAYFVSDKTSLDSAVSYFKQDYQQAGLFGYTEWKDVTWLNYQWTPLLNLSVGATGGIDDLVDNEGQTYGQLLARVRYKYAERLSFFASAGGELRHYDIGIADTLNPVFDLGATYHMGERTTLKLDANRGVYASVIGGAIYTVTGATLSAEQGITDRISTRLSGSYAIYDGQSAVAQPTTPSFTDNYFSLQLAVNVKIMSRLTGGVFYNYRDYSYSTASDITGDVAGLQLTWKY